MTLTRAPRQPLASFMGFELALDLETLVADVAILGVPYGAAYTIDEISNDQTNAPTAIRRACMQAEDRLERWDFDLGGTVFDGRPVRAVDCGDIAGTPHDLAAHGLATETAVRAILNAGALPIILGGDHGITVPVLRAYDGAGPLWVIQIDAHLDWRDRKVGVDSGYSSPMRRASELPFVDGVIQIGLRSQGSARPEEVEAARAYGARLITAETLHDEGVDAALAQVPDNARYYLTIDADGLDPSVMPAVAGPAPGGLSFTQAAKIVRGLARKGRVVGMDIVEITPARDVNQITAVTAVRLILNLIGSAVRAGYFDRPSVET